MIRETKLLESKLDELKPYLELSDQLEPAIEQILSTQDAFILCNPPQLLGLTTALIQEAVRLKRSVCILHADTPGEVERLLISTHLDSTTGKVGLFYGDLWKCVAEGGILIVLNLLNAMANEELNGLLDRMPMHDFTGQYKIEISKKLQIVAIHTAARDSFKVSSISKSLRERFGQIRWLPETLQLPATTIFTPESKYDPDCSTVTIDCGFLPGEQFSSHLLHRYKMDEKGFRSLVIGDLAKAVAESKGKLQIKLKNLKTDDPAAIIFFQELCQLTQPLVLDFKSYDFSQVTFFLEPPPALSELKLQTTGKVFQQITLLQMQDLEATGDVFLLNVHSANEYYELIYSHPVSGQSKHIWNTTHGFKDYLSKQSPVHLLVIGPLPEATWHRLIHDKDIRFLWALDSVTIPQSWRSLFALPKEKVSPPELKKTVLTKPWFRICVDKISDQPRKIVALKSADKTNTTIALHTTRESDESLVCRYIENNQYQPGPLLKALVGDRQRVIVSGETLLIKFPNLLKRQLLAVNGRIINLAIAKGEIILVIDLATLEKYPWLYNSPKLQSPEYKSLRPSKITAGGYEGFKQALEKNAITFVKGPKASGKSYSLSRLVKDKIGTVFQYTLSPTTSFLELKPLIKTWALENSETEDGLRILALDEMNLAKSESLLWLQGLVTTPEYFILPDGDTIHLNPKIHRFAGLMNPANSTTGREEHTLLESLAALVNFEPLTEEEIRKNVILPALKADCGFGVSLASSTADYLINFSYKVQSLRPDLRLDPRDFLAIIAGVASWNYSSVEMKNFEAKTPVLSSTSSSLEVALGSACFEVVSSQLSAPKQQALRHWLGLFAPTLPGPSPVCMEWVNQLLIENPALWNTAGSRRLMAQILGYLQIHSYYQQAHHRLMPGKSAFLILGETYAGKTFSSHYLAEKWGYRFEENAFEWTAGIHINLTEYVVKAKKFGYLLIIHEVNLLSTAILEGALNAALTGDASPYFALMMTANMGYNYRQKLSEPFLSRLKIVYADNPTPQELLNLHGVSEAEQKTLLKTYSLAGPSASIRGLRTVIRHRENKLDMNLACAMVFGLLLEEEFTSPQTPVAVPVSNPFNDFLTLVDDKRLIVSQEPAPCPLGALDPQRSFIQLPTLPVNPTTRDQQHLYNIILLRSHQYRIAGAMESKKSGANREFLWSTLHLLQAMSAVRHRYPRVDTLLPAAFTSINPLIKQDISDLVGLNAALQQCIQQITPKQPDDLAVMAICLQWQGLTYLAEEKLPHWERLSQLELLVGMDYPLLRQLKLTAKWIKQHQADFAAVLSGWSNLEKICPLMQELVKSAAELMSEQPVMEESVENDSLVTETASSAGRYLITDLKDIASVSDTQQLIYFPLAIHKIQDGKPVLDKGEYQLEALPSHFLAQEALDVKQTQPVREITLNLPLSIKGNAVLLPTPVGFYPRPLLEEIKVIKKQGKFYALLPSKEEKYVNRPLVYQLLEGRSSPISGAKFKVPRKYPPLINHDDLNFSLAQCVKNLEIAKDRGELLKAVFLLCEELKNNFYYLDTKDRESRQKLDSAYQENLAAVMSFCVQNSEVVCVESAVLLFDLIYFILEKFDIPVYLVSSLLSVQGKVTSLHHSYVMIYNSDGQSIILDPTPSKTKRDQKELKSSSLSMGGRKLKDEFMLTLNPLLRFFQLRVTSMLHVAISPLLTTTFAGQQCIYRPVPPGILNIKRDTLGDKNPYKLTLWEPLAQPQTLLVTSFPQFSDCIHEQFSCVHLLMEAGFKIMIWTGECRPILASDANHFFNLLRIMHAPSDSQLQSWKYPQPFIKMDKAKWLDFFKSCSKIFQEISEEKSYQAYVNAVTKKEIKITPGTHTKKPVISMEELKYDLYPQGAISYLGEDDHTIEVSRMDIDQKFINSLAFSGQIIFKNCKFIEKLNFSKSPFEITVIEIRRCYGFSPDWQTLPRELDFLTIDKDSYFADQPVMDVEALLNDNCFNTLKIENDLLPTCIRIKANYSLCWLYLYEVADTAEQEKILEKKHEKSPEFPFCHSYVRRPQELILEKDLGVKGFVYSVTILSSNYHSIFYQFYSARPEIFCQYIKNRLFSGFDYRHLTLILDIDDEKLNNLLITVIEQMKSEVSNRSFHFYHLNGSMNNYLSSQSSGSSVERITI